MNQYHYRARCSELGILMTKPRNVTAKLSETAKTHLQTWLKARMFWIDPPEIKSKFLQKGTDAEAKSIELVNQFYQDHYKKNEKTYKSDQLTGTPDIVGFDTVIELKTSWDLFTFPMWDEELDRNYYAQVQGYMRLTGLRKAKVIYCLVNTPFTLVESEIRRAAWDAGVDELTPEQEHAIITRHCYDHIPIQHRVKVYDVLYNDEFMQEVFIKISNAQHYINSLIRES